MNNLISVVGTTGIGKTKLAIALAKHFGTEIVSCDSRQFFSEMKIGTARPTDDELSEVQHHFIGNLSVQDYYSVGQFEKDALKKIEELFVQHNVVVMVGGSMMYEKAVVEGLNDLPQANEQNQQELDRILAEEGLEELQQLLKNLDPAYFEVVDRENPRRLLRAIDVIWQTGKSYTQNVSAQLKARDFQVTRVGIGAPREIIYDRINRRVDQMVADGLENEARSLLPQRSLPALNTVGYSEFFKYFDGEWTLDFAIDEIKKNSRRFAKRQLTWYRKESGICWVDYENAVEESLSLLKNLNIKS